MKHNGPGSIVAGLIAGLLMTHSIAAAQRPARPQPPGRSSQPEQHGRMTPPPSRPEQGPKPEPRAGEVQRFRGIASKLNTTPEALESAYEAARAANPKLTHGQFVVANVLAHNLGEKHPDITTQAILDGLKGRNSIGKTLHSLGLSDSEAKEAERAAYREIRDAQRADRAHTAQQPAAHPNP